MSGTPPSLADPSSVTDGRCVRPTSLGREGEEYNTLRGNNSAGLMPGC